MTEHIGPLRGDDEEPYRWCVFCGTDCYPPVEEQEHGPACPTVTGLWPIERSGSCWECSCPDCRADTPRYDLCKAPFSRGDEHALLNEDETRLAGPDDEVCIVVCIGCAAAVELDR